jgi:hypothetical protein
MVPTAQVSGRIVTKHAAWLTVALVLAGALSGCSALHAINKVRHAVDANRQIVNTFTQGLKSGKATPFQATYVTTGSSPTTVTYAVQPPKDVDFSETAADNSNGTADLDLVSNANGEYSCTSDGASAGWSCQKLSKVEALAQNQIVNLYTPSHWIAILDGLSFVEGIEGDAVSASTMTVNGFAMKCVNFSQKGVKGKSTICTTAQNILGYVKAVGSSTSFEIKSYSSSPSASAFQLPAGAKITNQK